MEGWQPLVYRISSVIVGLCLVLSSTLLAYDITLTDPVGDDYGPGSYLYATDPVFTPGSFDLVRFRAREIGSNIRFEIELDGDIEDPWGSGGGFSLQSIDIYIDTDGLSGSGSTSSLLRRNLGFSAASAWEFVVWVGPPFEGFATHVEDHLGAEYYSGISVSVDEGTDVMTVDVPKSILGTPDSGWRYLVLMLGQNGYEPGLVRSVDEQVGQWVMGGGDNSQWDSNVMDVAAEAGVNQEALLANYSVANGVQPVLINRVDASSPVISHTAPSEWEEHQPLDVTATITDDVVTGASLFYRIPPGAYQEQAMMPAGSDEWTAIIPGTEVIQGFIEYYIFATDATNPGTLPDPGSPFSVAITPDVTPPSIEALSSFPSPFSPNGDGYKDDTEITVALSEPAFVWVDILDSLGTPVRSLADSVFAEAALATVWDGRNQTGQIVADGHYQVVSGCVDLADNAGASEQNTVEVDIDLAIRRLDAILLFHANQNLVPYGKAANTACYKGVLNTLRAHPDLKFVIHFSGCLLSDLLWEDPEVIEVLKAGAADGQFEIVGSTYTQNIIYSTRSFDTDFQQNHHQIGSQKALIESALGVSPVSFWNAERVWTQNIVKLLADNDYSIVQVEDHILWDSGISGSEYAVRTTAYDGNSVYVFNDDKDFEGRVNGAIDSGDTSSVMGFLRGLYAEDVDDRYAVCYHEDMEATGLWDYENGENPAVDFANLDKLLTAFENDPTIKVTTYSDWLKEHQPFEDITPIVDGAAVWMGGDAWFTENAEPQAEAYRVFFDGIRDSINAIHSMFPSHAPDTLAARQLIDHAWFTLVAHQYEFAVHGYGGIAGTTQWDLAKTALVSARAAREALIANPRVTVQDINDDSISEIVYVTAGDLYVFSRYGGRLLYWFDLEDGLELVGNENFMRTYGEPYTNDNYYVPKTVGCEAYSWLCGNMIIPEILTYTFEARRRCFNDSVWIGGTSAGSLVNIPLSFAQDSSQVAFTYNLGDISITKTITPALHSLGLEYIFNSASSQAEDIEFEMENGLSPDCLGVMMTGRESLKYWDGQDTSSVAGASMPGVVNVISGKGVLFDFTDPPASISGEEDVFGLEVNPRWSFQLPAQGSVTLRATLNQQAFAGVTPGVPEGRQGRLNIMPNPSAGGVDLKFSVERAAAMKADIFDLSGKLVRSLHGRGAGPAITVSWDGTNRAGQQVANGIYFVKVSSGAARSYGKVIILR